MTNVVPIHYPFPEPPETGQALEIADGILWIRLPLPSALDHINVYALRETDGWTVIDTGIASRRTRAIWEQILSGPLGGVPVRRLIVTHHHPDHVGLAGWFQQRGVELCITRTAWLFARMLTLDEQDRPTKAHTDFWIRGGLSGAMLEAKRNERPFNFCDVVAPLPLGFTRLIEDETIEIGGRLWDIRFGHGHAPDHATFWCRDEPLIIAGDQLLASISPNIGVYPTEPAADPLADWLESCERFTQFAQDRQLVLVGHKLPYRGLPSRLTQLIENHKHALDRLLPFIAESPRTVMECLPALFKRAIDQGNFGLAFAEAVAHLNHLENQGLAGHVVKADGAWAYSLAS